MFRPSRLLVAILLAVCLGLLVPAAAGAQEAIPDTTSSTTPATPPDVNTKQLQGVEAALAGALGFSLGGPRLYDGETHNLASLGDGRRDLSALDILKALELYWMMLNLTLGVTIGAGLVMWRFG